MVTVMCGLLALIVFAMSISAHMMLPLFRTVFLCRLGAAALTGAGMWFGSLAVFINRPNGIILSVLAAMAAAVIDLIVNSVLPYRPA